MKKEYQTQIYFSTFVTVNVSAENEEEAIETARDLVNTNLTENPNLIADFLGNMENYQECDEAKEI